MKSGLGVFHERLESQKASSQKEPLSKAIYFSVFLRAIGTISTYTFDNYVNFVVVAFRDDLFHVSQLNADFGKKIAYIIRYSVKGFYQGILFAVLTVRGGGGTSKRLAETN